MGCPANRPTNHTHTAMPLRMQSSITSNLEIRHRLLNSMKRPRDTSHNVHRNSPCPSATPVGDKASLRNFTDRFTHGTTKCLWTWKMSVSQRNYSKLEGLFHRAAPTCTRRHIASWTSVQLTSEAHWQLNLQKNRWWAACR